MVHYRMADKPEEITARVSRLKLDKLIRRIRSATPLVRGARSALHHARCAVTPHATTPPRVRTDALVIYTLTRGISTKHGSEHLHHDGLAFQFRGRNDRLGLRKADGQGPFHGGRQRAC